jgi:hypothetical protein
VTDAFQIEVPVTVIDEIVDRVTSRVKAEIADSSPWLTRQSAADYLGVPVSRLEKDRSVPSHRWDGRVLYHRSELDAFLIDQ